MKRISFLTTIVLLFWSLILVLPVAASPPAPQGIPHAPIIRGDIIDIGPWIRNVELPIEGAPEIPPMAAAQAGYNIGDKRLFLALDNYRGYYFFTTYTVVTMTEKVEVWVQDDLHYYDLEGNMNLAHPDWPETITEEQINYLANEFINNIEPTDVQYFGEYDVHTGENALLSLWGYVHEGYYQRADKANATIILISNVRDARFYNPVTAPYYIAGFYSPSFERYADRNIITIDCKDWEMRLGAPGKDWGAGEVTRPYLYESVTVHEFQHLIHDDHDPDEDSWVNEGCSEYSEYLAGYKIDQYHGRTEFLDNPENSLVVWGDPGVTILSDYQQSYLWTLRLGEKFGPDKIKNYVEEDENGIMGFNAVYTNTTFLDEFNGFRDEVLWGGDTSTFPSAWGWGPGVSPVLDMGRLLRNLDSSAYYYPGVPPYGADYIKVFYGPGSTVYFDGDESAPPTRWKVTSELPVPASGEVSGNVLYSGHSDYDERWVIFPVHVPAPSTPGGAWLSFDTFYNIEDNWDFGFVQVTTDTTGMTGWTSLPLPGTTTETDPDAHPIIKDNVPGFTGLITPTTWTKVQYNLEDYANQDILLAFRYAADWASAGSKSDYDPGWWIDNVRVGNTDLFTETLPANAMSLKQAQGWTVPFRVTFFAYQNPFDPNNPGWITKTDMTLSSAMTGTFDLDTILTDTSRFVVVAISAMPPLLEDVIGNGFSPQYISYTLTGLPGSIATSDVAITDRTAGYDFPGGVVTYTVYLRNTGDVTVTNVTVTNPVPANTTFYAATGGATHSGGVVNWTGNVPPRTATSPISFTFGLKINDCLAPDTLITNTTYFDDGQGNPVFSRDIVIRVRSPFRQSYILAPDKVAEGDVISYTIGLINTDSITRTVKVEIDVPEGTSLKSLSIGPQVSAAGLPLSFSMDVPPYELAKAPLPVQVELLVEEGYVAKYGSTLTETLKLYDVVYGASCDKAYDVYTVTSEVYKPFKIYLPIVMKNYQ